MSPELLASAVDAMNRSEQASASNPADRPFFADELPEVRACIPMDVIERAAGELAGPGVALDAAPRLVYIPRRHEPGAVQSPGGWHVDLVYPMLTPDVWAVNTFVFLTPVRSGGGAFRFLAGSPRRIRADMLRNSPDSIAHIPDGAGRDAEVIGEVEFLAEPGDVLLYSYLLSHAASPNRTDPQTRHAFGGGTWRPVSRLEPNRTGLAEMSTLEKASATRYQRSVDPALPDYTPAPTAPRSPRFAGPVRTHATLRRDGLVHLFAVEEPAPGLVRQLTTRDFAEWTEATPLRLPAGTSVHSLAVEHRPGPALLVAAGRTDGTRDVLRFQGDDGLTRWREGDAIRGALVAQTTFAHPAYGSAAAQGLIDFFVPAEDPAEVRWSCRMETRGGELLPGAALRIDDGRRIEDVLIKPAYPTRHCAVVQLDDGELAYTHSATIDRFPDPLQPLDTGGMRVRNLRLHDRARSYWLLTYVDAAGTGIGWGAIDWEQGGRLRALDSSEALRDALGTVGLI
jgi:hypothetical protein